ncbi:Glutamyl aminopeptidase [Portunus trituberculatus]|uniref:Glutamyl aminopeptidase n=2 Tax=Portunus trituberculatus TaxID=210409 RepID=A0A5B7I6B4_PORTR|nr:Glutamyl aminopeptidase [Portunus trituberculatus]
MGQVFIRRSTAVLLFLVGALCIVCVALLVLLLAPDWRQSGGETSAHSMPLDATPRTSPAAPAPRNTPVNTPVTTTDTAPKEPWEKEYRIPRTTLPYHYDLYLHPNMEQGDFTGKVTLLIGVTAPITYLVTHVKKLNVTSTVLVRRGGGGEEEVEVERSFEYAPNEFWVVVPDHVLLPGNYSLTLEFAGTLTGSIVGFYRSTYTNAAGEKR